MLTAEFQALEKSDIMIRNDMKHNINKIKKARESIEGHNKKKQNLVEEAFKNEKDMPGKEKEQ